MVPCGSAGHRGPGRVGQRGPRRRRVCVLDPNERPKETPEDLAGCGQRRQPQPILPTETGKNNQPLRVTSRNPGGVGVASVFSLIHAEETRRDRQRPAASKQHIRTDCCKVHGARVEQCQPQLPEANREAPVVNKIPVPAIIVRSINHI